MGGLGSSRWGGYTKNVPVEDCRVINIDQLIRKGFLNCCYQSGWINWKKGGQVTGAVKFVVSRNETDGIITLEYELSHGLITEEIGLQSTRIPHSGGLRWWFTCPLILDGIPCQRRIKCLYLPPGERYFGCRTCYGLTYRVCQEKMSKSLDLM